MMPSHDVLPGPRGRRALCHRGPRARGRLRWSDDEGGGDSDFAKQSGDKIAADAKADMKDLDEVKFSGEITSDGDTITLDVQASSAGDCTGSIGIGGGTAEILAKDGTNWFKPDEAFWRANAADPADAIIAAVGDKWVLDTDSNFSQFCDLDAFFDNLFKDDDEHRRVQDHRHRRDRRRGGGQGRAVRRRRAPRSATSSSTATTTC